jgi:hypothetical protein
MDHDILKRRTTAQLTAHTYKYSTHCTCSLHSSGWLRKNEKMQFSYSYSSYFLLFLNSYSYAPLTVLTVDARSHC